MSSRLNDINLAFLDQSDTIIEIVTYDSTTIHNTIAMADTFRLDRLPGVARSATSSTAPTRPAASTRSTSSGRSAACPEHRVVSDGRLVVQSNNEGVPFVLANPTAQISQDVMRIAGELLDSGRVAAAAGRS